MHTQSKWSFSRSCSAAITILAVSVIQLGLVEMAMAQRVQPMVFELEPMGSKSSTSLRIENTQQQPLTVEIIPTKITMDEFGNETLSPAEDDFLIYPPQTLIDTGKTQIVRVKYIGDPTINSSQAYRVSVKQLPVNLRESGHTGVGMVINFNTLVNVAPATSKPSLSVTEVQAGDGDRWNIVIENKGDRFSRLSTTTWEVSDTRDAALSKRIKSMEVGQLTEKNLVLPYKTLRLSIPAIEGFDPANIHIDIVDG